MPVIMNELYRRGGLGWTAAAARSIRRISGTAAILAVALLALPPFMRPAQAIDVNPGATNASLVFSHTFLGAGQKYVICAQNLSDVNVKVTLVVDSSSANQNLNSTYFLSPGVIAC